MITFLFSIPKQRRIILSIFYLSIIALLSLLPSDDFPSIPTFEFADKLVHVSMYLGLTWLMCWTFTVETKPFRHLIILFFSVFWGFLMEIFQLVMKMGRTFDYYDILGNTIGAVIGIIIYVIMIHYKKNSDMKRSRV